MSRSGVLCVSLLAAAMASAYAQQQEGVTPPAPQAQPVQAKVPLTIEDGGFSLEPLYWFTTFLPTTPVMKGGASAAASNADLIYPGIIKNTPGVVLSIPAGRQSTIRLSYFRGEGRGDEAAATNLNLLGTPFNQGDWLATTYRVQQVKASWDFLTYPLPAGPRKIRFKTLWEVQWLWFSTHINAPYAPVVTDSSGNTISNYAYETKNIILPTLGGEVEQAPFRHFRYELKASGFTIPHHSDIWEAEGSVALRFGKLELLAGAKAVHFKTSAQSDEYFAETLSGPYAGVRYYLNRQQ
ncbi:MAG: hypothetical protein ABSF98_06970 [Bryobacteraceae bacterium]|jgi:hypothetical protein